jgi:hypothetical protein
MALHDVRHDDPGRAVGLCRQQGAHADAPAAQDRNRIAQLDLAPADRMQADGQRLDQSAFHGDTLSGKR